MSWQWWSSTSRHSVIWLDNADVSEEATDVSEEATPLSGCIKMQVVFSSENSAPTYRNIRRHTSKGNSKLPVSYSKGDHAGEKPNSSQAQNIHLCYLKARRKFLVSFQFFPYSLWFRKWMCLVHFLSNLQFTPLTSHTVSNRLSTDGRTVTHTIVQIGIVPTFL